MKTALVCAIFLAQFAANGREPLAAAPRRCGAVAANVTMLYGSRAVRLQRQPAPVAAMTTGNGPTVEGVFLRMATAPEPLQMLNPLAPPQYGSAGNLVTYSKSDGYRNGNPYQHPWQANGIRLLTFRPFW